MHYLIKLLIAILALTSGGCHTLTKINVMAQPYQSSEGIKIVPQGTIEISIIR